MEVFRAGEALLRSSTGLLPFLAPSAYRLPPSRRAATACLTPPPRTPPLQRPTRRAFTTTRCRDAAAAAAARAPEPEDDAPPTASRAMPSTPPSSRDSLGDEISALLDSSISRGKGTPTAPTGRTSRFSSPRAQSTNPPSRGLARPGDSGRSPSQNSYEDIMEVGRSLDPLGNTRTNYGPPPQINEERAPMKLDSTIGRSIPVKDPADVGRAFRSLDMLCARNSVRRDFQRQRFHERPGLKRKRLKSERWRRNFKGQFKATVAMVQAMKKQGW